jgi:hypothetical protein
MMKDSGDSNAKSFKIGLYREYANKRRRNADQNDKSRSTVKWELMKKKMKKTQTNGGWWGEKKARCTTETQLDTNWKADSMAADE